nr:MAG TPA: hypothetical protein [Caudoviricetes sp.]
MLCSGKRPSQNHHPNKLIFFRSFYCCSSC